MFAHDFLRSRRITWCVQGPDWGGWTGSAQNSTVRGFTSAIAAVNRCLWQCDAAEHRTHGVITATTVQTQNTVDGLRLGYSTWNNMVGFVTSATLRIGVSWRCGCVTQIRRSFLIHLFVNRASCSHIRRRSCVCTFPAVVYVVMFCLFVFHAILSRNLLWRKQCEMATAVAR